MNFLGRGFTAERQQEYDEAPPRQLVKGSKMHTEYRQYEPEFDDESLDERNNNFYSPQVPRESMFGSSLKRKELDLFNY